MGKAIYRCQKCGASHAKWVGQCSDCGDWNSVMEEAVTSGSSKKNKKLQNTVEIFDLNATDDHREAGRILTRMEEFDRVVGGGMVIGSSILIYGEPGIGKSTLLIQICATVAASFNKCLYISGEESISQIRLRAQRLGIESDNVKLLSEMTIDSISEAISLVPNLRVVVIDSIQMISTSELSSPPGTVSQIKACTFELTDIAKKRQIIIIIVGQVTKEGGMAGPKTLEHMVDTVLSFEGESIRQQRIIRAVKNRYGSTNEIGVFEMSGKGLCEVPNPSDIFLSRHDNAYGSCIFAGHEGTRSILLEVQALVAPSFMPSPRRSAIGWDVNRLSMLIAILTSTINLKLMDKEVYLNIAGGLKIVEPAIDLAVAASLISTCFQIALPQNTVFFGEIGLLGELRSISHTETRIKEAKKLGFKRVVMSEHKKVMELMEKQDIEIIMMKNVRDLCRFISENKEVNETNNTLKK